MVLALACAGAGRSAAQATGFDPYGAAASPSDHPEPWASPEKAMSGAPTLGAAATNISKDGFTEGAREAPRLLKETGVTCTIVQAAHIGDSTLLDASGKAIGHAKLYETACAEGLGYLFNERPKQPTVVFDCIAAARTRKAACMLPMNSHPAGGLNPYLKAAGVPCSALRARPVGQDATLKIRRYEVACSGGGGYMLDMPLADGSGAAPRAADCLEVAGDCNFTPHVESVAMLAFKIGVELGDTCKVGDARYIGYVAARSNKLYELSCQTGHDGLLVELDRGGQLQKSYPCKGVKLVGATCMLGPVKTIDPLIVLAQRVGDAPPMVWEHPDWVNKPSGSTFSKFYPSLALRFSVSGQVVLNCRTNAEGATRDCFVVDESPAGFGFGDAAVKISGEFRMKPALADGVPVEGAQVDIPINFKIGY